MSDVDIEARARAELESAASHAVLPPVGAILAAAQPQQASPTAVIAEIKDLRITLEQLRASIERTGVAELRVTTLWTVRDVVAHLASWAAETRREAEHILAGRAFDYTIHFEAAGGPRSWNQREVEQRAGKTLDELFDELDDEHQRLIELVFRTAHERLTVEADLPRTSGEPPRAWHMSVGAMIVAGAWHTRLHIARIEDIVRAG
jgi:hypothetical protein